METARVFRVWYELHIISHMRPTNSYLSHNRYRYRIAVATYSSRGPSDSSYRRHAPGNNTGTKYSGNRQCFAYCHTLWSIPSDRCQAISQALTTWRGQPALFIERDHCFCCKYIFIYIYIYFNLCALGCVMKNETTERHKRIKPTDTKNRTYNYRVKQFLLFHVQVLKFESAIKPHPYSHRWPAHRRWHTTPLATVELPATPFLGARSFLNVPRFGVQLLRTAVVPFSTCAASATYVVQHSVALKFWGCVSGY